MQILIILFLLNVSLTYCDQVRDILAHDAENTHISVENYQHPYIFISLGSDCKVTTYIRNSGLNSYSYPLDWLLSFDCNAVCDLIENNFEEFFLLKNLQDLGGYCRTTGYYHVGNAIILDFVHDIEFRHDFLANATMQVQYEAIYKKYQRRIKRLYRALNQTERKVYLVRKQISKTQAMRLSKIISSKFPSLNFDIIALDNTEEIQIAWNIPHVKNFYFDNPSFIYDFANKKYIHVPTIRHDLWDQIVKQIL